MRSSAEGKRALAPRIQLTLSQNDINPFRIGRAPGSIPKFVPLPSVEISDEMTRVDISIGDKQVDLHRILIEAKGDKYIGPSGNTEATIEKSALNGLTDPIQKINTFDLKIYLPGQLPLLD